MKNKFILYLLLFICCTGYSQINNFKNFKRLSKSQSSFLELHKHSLFSDQKLSKKQLLELNQITDSALFYYNEMNKKSLDESFLNRQQKKFEKIQLYRSLMQLKYGKPQAKEPKLDVQRNQKLYFTLDQTKEKSIICCDNIYDYLLFSYYALTEYQKMDFLIIFGPHFTSLSGISILAQNYSYVPVLDDSTIYKARDLTFNPASYPRAPYKTKEFAFKIKESITYPSLDYKGNQPLNISSIYYLNYCGEKLLVNLDLFNISDFLKYDFIEQMNRPYTELTSAKSILDKSTCLEGLFCAHLRLKNSLSDNVVSDFNNEINDQLSKILSIDKLEENDKKKINSLYYFSLKKNPNNLNVFQSHWFNRTSKYKEKGDYNYVEIIALIVHKKMDIALKGLSGDYITPDKYCQILSICNDPIEFDQVYNAISSKYINTPRLIYVFQENNKLGLRTRDSICVPANFNSYEIIQYGFMDIAFVLYGNEGSQSNYNNYMLNYTPKQTVFPDTSVKINENSFDKVNKSIEGKIYDFVEIEPEYPGGLNAMYLFIKTNLKYPEKAKLAKAQGKVYVSFVVNSDGYIVQSKIVVNKTPELDAEAIRLVESMPNWTPGKQKGEAVNCRYYIPVLINTKVTKATPPKK